MIKKITGMLFCLGILSGLSAQVTIGIAEDPAEGALLQLKDIVKAAKGGENAKKGLLMPRVGLVDYMNLDPMFPTATPEQKKEHAGLIVYNLTENDNLQEGIMVWNGEMWNLIKNKEIKKELDSDIKKTLYTHSGGAIEGNSVSLGSIEATLHSYPGNYFANPYFRLKEKPGANGRKFHYQAGQYWTGYGYTYDMDAKSFDQGNYQAYLDFTKSTMDPKERNEVWIFEDGSTEIYRIQFITLGEENTTASNIFAILVERF